jgi:starch phosphorylase
MSVVAEAASVCWSLTSITRTPIAKLLVPYYSWRQTQNLPQAILSKQRAETLSSVLYPDDRTYEGKELRLKQQHFFVSATVQDVVRRYKERHDDWDAFADKVSFQMNDTHPTLLVPELMRVLMDLEGLGWTKAWELVTQVRIESPSPRLLHPRYLTMVPAPMAM